MVARGAITQVDPLRAMLKTSKVDRSKLSGEGQRIRSSGDRRNWRADQSTKAPTARCEIVTPFGTPGGPGREQDEGRILRRAVAHGSGSAASWRGSPARRSSRRSADRPRSAARRRPSRVGHDEPGVAVVQHRVDAAAGPVRLDRHVGPAGAQRREQGRDRVRGLLHDEADPVSGLEAVMPEGGGDRRAALEELSQRDHEVVLHHGRLVRVPGGRGAQPLVQESGAVRRGQA